MCVLLFTFQCHSNETLTSLRQKIINRLNQTQEFIQIHVNDKLVGISLLCFSCCCNVTNFIAEREK
jgi:hypothetical protein